MPKIVLAIINVIFISIPVGRIVDSEECEQNMSACKDLVRGLSNVARFIENLS